LAYNIPINEEPSNLFVYSPHRWATIFSFSSEKTSELGVHLTLCGKKE
jgi:hypothetical protein